ncbi:metalloprotease TldD [Candidatus Erwinia haradaeae]|uniref:Metalloprotease TldD n=1 Tax=Candidatus Erwinia haradaeae TaxID=1922217 RepID=A0A451D7T1_9GAMM|nr:metalloprotease TldD [Candidatus Erwinia haradaeae]VFP81878.1 Metalloprotease TldD [Candidatus Erwinia haradaeae]
MNVHFLNDQLLSENNLSHHDLTSILGYLFEKEMDYSDLYFQSRYQESWVLEDRMIKDGAYGLEKGLGVRAVRGEKTGFAYADQITLDALQKSSQAARNIVSEQGNKQCHVLGKQVFPARYLSVDPLSSLTCDEKVLLLHQVDNVARLTDERVRQVTASLTGVYEQVLIAATDGTLVADIRPLVLLSISVQVEDRGKRERGFSGGGGRFGYEFFLENVDNEVRAEVWAREAVRMALVNLYALEAPAGSIPVVLGSGWPGILLHEAVGHGLEGDFNRLGTSIFSGRVGQQVASECCTVVDDGTKYGLRGSLSVDDEGVPGQYTTLIEKGFLKGYMQDKLNARLMGSESTGNGRRESYSCLPMPRMTNTYMLAGDYTPQEIIESVEYGLYAPNFHGGQVDITSGQFSFSTSEAYLIKNGVIRQSVKGATLIGSGIEVMQAISMVGNDLHLDSGVAVCGKDGQNIPVGVGQPTVKIDNLTVGGCLNI